MNKNNVSRFSGLAVGLALVMPIKGHADMKGLNPSPATVSVPGTPAPSTSSLTMDYKNYTYYGDRYRDPFVPLTGDVRSDQSTLDRPPQIASLTLKGIIQDAKGRMALLVSGVSSYVLKGGRLYDGRNRMIKKIAGVIKTDSVVLIGADRTVRELKTKLAL